MTKEELKTQIQESKTAMELLEILTKQNQNQKLNSLAAISSLTMSFNSDSCLSIMKKSALEILG